MNRFEAWKAAVLRRYPTARFTVDDGQTYGDIGDWTAHVGPDMQADVVGVYVLEDERGTVFLPEGEELS